MFGRSSPREHSLQFSNSSSFSSVSDSSEENASIVEHLQPLVDTGALKSTPPLTSSEVLGLPPRRTAPLVNVISLLRSESEDDSDFDESDDALRTTAPGPSHRVSFSETRDSTSPPTMSSYFKAAAESDVDAGLRALPPWEEEMAASSFEEVPTPRSIAGFDLAQPSSDGHDSPLVSPARSRITVDHSALSPLVETVAVNASRARNAHERLFTFSAATMAQYQLVKLKVKQRIYRIYYDKWRRRLSPSTVVQTVQRLGKDTQTPSVRLRSVSIGTEFVDIDSFHASRAASVENTPRSWTGQLHTPQRRQPSLSLLRDSSPPPRRSDGARPGGLTGVAEADRRMQPQPSPPLSASPSPLKTQAALFAAATAWAPSPSVTRLQSSTARTPSPDVRPAHEWPPPLTPPPTDGIAARTKPSKLVDFGRHSDAPRRKSAHVSNPVVTEPKVVPSPERIFRL